MVYQCSVKDCPTKRDRSIARTLHRFPKNDPRLCNIWKLKVGLAEDEVIENKRVCSLHFKQDDFNPDTKRVTLKANAIPTRIQGKIYLTFINCESLMAIMLH